MCCFLRILYHCVGRRSLCYFFRLHSTDRAAIPIARRALTSSTTPTSTPSRALLPLRHEVSSIIVCQNRYWCCSFWLYYPPRTHSARCRELQKSQPCGIGCDRIGAHQTAPRSRATEVPSRSSEGRGIHQQHGYPASVSEPARADDHAARLR